MADAPSQPGPAGRPPKDELDPELVSLARPLTRVGPLLCIAVIGFSAYLMIKVWPDLSFRRGGDQPQRAAGGAALLAAGAESYVAATLQPDHAFALRVPGSGGREGSRLVPVHGTGNRLWLMVDGEPWIEKPTYDEQYQGRLRRLDSLPFAAALRRAASGATVPRWVAAGELRAALEQHGGTVRDPFGDDVEVGDGTQVVIAERVQKGARLLANKREFLPSEAAWLDALGKAGLTVVPPRAVDSDDKGWTFEVNDPGGVPAVMQKLVAGQIYSASVEPLDREHRAAWRDLASEPEGLRVAGARVAWDNVAAVALTAPRRVPGDAMVLIAGERPDGYWYVWPVFIALGLIAVLFIWALIRAVRFDRPAPTASVVEP